MNATKEYAKKLLNYRFKNDLGHVKTANIIEVYKSTTQKFKSNIDTLTIWTTIISDFVPQFLKKVLSEINKPKEERFNRMKVLKMYRDPYDHLLNDIYYTCRTRQIGVHNESNFDTVKFLIEDYKYFLKWVKEINSFITFETVQTAEVPKKYTKPIQHFKQVLTYEKGHRGLHYTRQYY